jgi:hypothetical protein
MARLIESSLWVDFTRSNSPLALKTLIQPWVLDPLACLCEPIAALSIHHDAELITFDPDYLAIARVSKLRVQHLSRNLP